MLERVGISLEDTLLEKFDRLIERRGYENRSEAIRDLIRDQLVQEDWSERGHDTGEKVAVVSIVYDTTPEPVAEAHAHPARAPPRGGVVAPRPPRRPPLP